MSDKILKNRYQKLKELRSAVKLWELSVSGGHYRELLN
jgi:hypothetical protein